MSRILCPGTSKSGRRAGRLRLWLCHSDWITSGGNFTGGEGVEYRWKSHKRRLQVALLDVMPPSTTLIWRIQLIRTNDDAKAPVAQYHIYRRHFFVFRMSRHAFLEIKPEATVEGLDKLIGRGLHRRAYSTEMIIDVLQ